MSVGDLKYKILSLSDFRIRKTAKTVRKYEKEFAKEIEDLSTEKRKTLLESSKVASQVVSSYNKTI